jgi:anaerobic magnesium-protoporphyrin IX monomethyl ester cyclase
MLSILVAHSYFLRFDPKQLARAKPYPPLATLQVASLLRKGGHRVALFDAMLAEGPQEFAHALGAVRPQLVLLYEDNFNYLSKMCLARMRRAACEMIAAARRDGARVIAAGSDETDDPEPYLRAGADVVLLGEGLPALEQLAARLDSERAAGVRDTLAGVPGTAWLTRGGVVRGSTASVRSEAAPRGGAAQPETPAWDLVDIERYRGIWRNAHGYFSLNMAASRGCSFRCAWCAKPIWGNRYLQRDAAAVAEEMIQLKRRFGPDHIWFADDIFGFRVDWVRDFAARVEAAGGPVPFTIQTRADLVSARMASALKAAARARCDEQGDRGRRRTRRARAAESGGHPGRAVHPARVSRGRVGGHSCDARSDRTRSARRRGCERVLSAPGNALLRAREGAARGEETLAAER